MHWTRSTDLGEGASLLVCRAGDDLDLAIARNRVVTYSRTVRLPRHEEEASILAGLISEIRRTMLVAPPQGGSAQPVENILLFGNTPRLAAFAARLQEELSLPTRVVDPFATSHFGDAAPEDSGLFAPLVGMLHDEAKKTHAFDFLNPRRPPAPPDRRRQVFMLAGILAAIIAAGSWHVWDSLNELDTKNRELELRLRDLEQTWKKASRKGAIVQMLDNWQAASVNWLDELRDLSARFPSSRDAVVLHLTLSETRDGSGEIDLTGRVRDPEIVRRMENGLRDDFHQLRIPRVQEREMNKNYTWHFDSQVLVKPRTREQYTAHFSGRVVPAEDAPDKGTPEKIVPVSTSAPKTPISPTGTSTNRKKSGRQLVINLSRQNLLFALLGCILLYFGGEWLFETVLEGPRPTPRPHGQVDQADRAEGEGSHQGVEGLETAGNLRITVIAVQSGNRRLVLSLVAD